MISHRSIITYQTVTMGFKLHDYQLEAVNKLRTGSILKGGVGSGKSLTSIFYYYVIECEGNITPRKLSLMKKPKDLYIITTARKRDTFEWEKELSHFLLNNTDNPNKTKVIIDSWNNIAKYSTIKNAFFIFDEQRLIGSGAWVKAFLKIAKTNNWIILSATPGDTWMDYAPVFIANGFYRNRQDFIDSHVIYSRFSKYPKIDRYINPGKLLKHRKDITVTMHYRRPTITEYKDIICNYDAKIYTKAVKDRWNTYESKPVKDAGQLCYLTRRIVNTHESRISEVYKILRRHPKLIIFYNFNYELDILRSIDITKGEWNGQKHEPIPDTDSWVYLVQYTAGAEGWNCIETDAILFYSLNYSYKIMTQAAGRIDRMNTPFEVLYYYRLISTATIDAAILTALDKKGTFHEKDFKFA